jgi:hypothetical protein
MAGAGATGRASDVWYPLPRRGVRVVDGAALEKRCAKAPRVRIPPSPPPTRPPDRPAGAMPVGFAVRGGFMERSPSGLWRRTGNAVRGNPSRVRIPPSPPTTPPGRTPMGALADSGPRSRTSECARCSPRRPPSPERPPGQLGLDRARARTLTGALAGSGPRSRTSECARCSPRRPPSPSRPRGRLVLLSTHNSLAIRRPSWAIRDRLSWPC